MVMSGDRTPPCQRRGSACCRLPREEQQNGRAGRGTAQCKDISVGRAVGRAEGYQRFRLGGHPQHHLDQQQAREEAANLCWRFLAGTKKLEFLPIISGPRLGPEAQM